MNGGLWRGGIREGEMEWGYISVVYHCRLSIGQLLAFDLDYLVVIGADSPNKYFMSAQRLRKLHHDWCLCD